MRQAEQSVALDAKLPAMLQGHALPVDAAEGLALGRICFTKHLYGAAARFYAEALAADLGRANDLVAAHRFLAACAAAMAGCGQANDDHPPDAVAAADFRRQAREWLRADLTARTEQLDAGTAAAREAVRKALTIWKSDPTLAGVRAPEALAKLPAEEQEARRTLWSGVDALLTRRRAEWTNTTASSATSCTRRSTRNSAGSLRNIAPRWCSATSRGCRTRPSRDDLGGRLVRSVRESHGGVTAWVRG